MAVVYRDSQSYFLTEAVDQDVSFLLDDPAGDEDDPVLTFTKLIWGNPIQQIRDTSTFIAVANKRVTV